MKAYEAAPTLIELLASPDEDVRRNAVEALGWLGDIGSKTAGDPILKMLCDEPDDLMRNEIVEALGRLRYAPALEKVKSILHKDSDWVIRASAAEALGEIASIGDSEVLAALELALDDPIEPVRCYAACSIGLLGIPRSGLLEKLQMYLSSEESLDTKAEILAARYRLGAGQDLPRMLELLESADEDLTVRILIILGDLIKRKTPEYITKDLSYIHEHLNKVIQSGSIHSCQAKQIIAELNSLKTDRS